MSHIDESMLGAYVDGDASLTTTDIERIERHTGSCPECRTLLDEVRSNRALAADILSRSGPDNIAMPDFSEIMARSQARRSPRRFRFGYAHGVAVAAVLVIAVSVGVFTGRAGQGLMENQPQFAAEGAPEVEQERVPSAVAMRAAGEAADEGVPARAAAPAPAEPNAQNAPATPPPANRALREEGPRQQPSPLASGAGGAAQETPADTRGFAGEEPARARDQIAAERFNAETVAVLADDAAGRRSEAARVAAGLVAAEAEERAGATVPTPADGFADTADCDLPPNDDVQVMIPCMPIVAVDTVRMGGRDIQRVTQLVGGNHVRLIAVSTNGADGANELDRIDERAPAQQRARAANSTSVTLSGYRIIVSGPLSSDSLRTLAASARINEERD